MGSAYSICIWGLFSIVPLKTFAVSEGRVGEAKSNCVDADMAGIKARHGAKMGDCEWEFDRIRKDKMNWALNPKLVYDRIIKMKDE